MPSRRRSRAGLRGRRPIGLPGRGRGAPARLYSRANQRNCGFRSWFLMRLEEIVAAEDEVRSNGLPSRRARNATAEGHGFFRCAPGAAGASLGPSSSAKWARPSAAGGSGVVHTRSATMTGGSPRPKFGSIALKLGVRPGVQADRQLRCRVRCGDALSLLDLRSAAVRRAGGRGGRFRPAEGR